MPSKGPKLIFIELFLLVGIYATILSVAEVTYASAFGRNYQSLMSNNEQIKIFTKNAGAEHPYNIKSGSNNSPSSIIKSTLGIFDSVVKGKLTATANFFTSEKKLDEVDAVIPIEQTTSQNPSQSLGEKPITITTVTLVTKSPPTTVMEAYPTTLEPDNNKDPNSSSNPNSEKGKTLERQEHSDSNNAPPISRPYSEKEKTSEIQEHSDSNNAPPISSLDSEKGKTLERQEHSDSNNAPPISSLDSEKEKTLERQEHSDSNNENSKLLSSSELQKELIPEKPVALEQPKSPEQQIIEAQKQVTSATINSSEVICDLTERSIQARLQQLNYSTIGAGDEDNMVLKNLWISGSMGTAKYNGKNTLTGYSNKTTAVTIGSDVELPSGSIIGGTYNHVISDFKYNNHIDRVVAYAHVISIYGQTNLSKKLTLQGFLSLALGNVSTKIPVQKRIDKANLTNISYSSKLVIAHHSQVGKVLITPNIGLRYGGYNIVGYNENFEVPRLSIAVTNGQRVSGLIGFELTMPLKINNTIQAIPGIHMEVERFLHNKQKKLYMQILSGSSNNGEKILLFEKLAKYNYKIGGTITIKRGATEIMVVYDYLASDYKYSSHQGSLKLKLSF